MDPFTAPHESLSPAPPPTPHQAATPATMQCPPIMERAVGVRIRITGNQRAALLAVLGRSPEARVHVAGFTVRFDMDNPRGWLEARTAEWPHGEFPQASLYAVQRKLSTAIQGQVRPDLAPPVWTQAEPDPGPADTGWLYDGHPVAVTTAQRDGWACIHCGAPFSADTPSVEAGDLQPTDGGTVWPVAACFPSCLPGTDTSEEGRA